MRMSKPFKCVVFYCFIRYFLTLKIFIFFSSRGKKKKDNKENAVFLWKYGTIGGCLYIMILGQLRFYIQMHGTQLNVYTLQRCTSYICLFFVKKTQNSLQILILDNLRGQDKRKQKGSYRRDSFLAIVQYMRSKKVLLISQTRLFPDQDDSTNLEIPY